MYSLSISGNVATIQNRLKGFQALVDRQQFNNRRPGIHQILERVRDLAESRQDLLQYAEGDLSRRNGRDQDQVGKDIVRLNVQPTKHVEIHVVEIQPKIVFANMREQFADGHGFGAVFIILAVNQFLAVGRLDALVPEFKSRQFDANNRQQHRAKGGPEYRGPKQRRRYRADDRQLSHMLPTEQNRTGRKANRVMTESTMLTPRLSMMPAKRIVSSWTRWDAPSMWRTSFQRDM